MPYIPTTLISQGGGGGWTTLHDETLSSAAASLDVSGISQSYDILQIRIVGRSARVSTFDSVLMRFNNDSGTNYDLSGYQLSNTGIFVAPAIAQDHFGSATDNPYVVQIPAANSPANCASEAIIDVLDYSQTTWNKQIRSQWFGAMDQNTSDIRIGASGGQWRSTAAVTRVTFVTGSASNFVTGTHLTILGFAY